MHRLSEVRIQNYKSIKDLKLKLTDYTPLVGYNNAGKSNILEAIQWFLKPSKLVEEDFYDKRNGDGVFIQAKIEGLDESILELLSDKNQKKIIPFIESDSVKFQRELENPGTARQANLNVWHPEEEEWKPNPGGIDNAIKELFPEPIFIRAMEDATEDISKNKRSTTIGKILKEITDPIAEAHKEKIEGTLGRLDDLFGADGDDRIDDLVKIDSQLESVIEDFFPDINLKLHIPAPTLDDIFKSGTVQVIEGDSNPLRDFDSLGHGAQRAIQMALIRFLAERDKQKEKSSSRKFLLIEEPELYLHPQAITFLSQALKKLSKGVYQVIFATHSPIMISKKDIGITALIRKNNDKGTYRQNTLNEAIDETLEGKGVADRMFALENSSQLLFADNILLIEGITEKKIIPRLFESYYDLSSFQTQVSFINLDGAPGVENAVEILESMGLNYKILVDLDYCFNNAIDHGYLKGTEAPFTEAVNIIKSSTKELNIDLDEDWPDSPKYLKSKNYEKLVKNDDFQKVVEALHLLLLDKNIWIWQTGPIEVPLGLDNKSTKDREQFLIDLRAEEISDLVADFDQIDEFFNWTMN